jgi:hypothetical protein
MPSRLLQTPSTWQSCGFHGSAVSFRRLRHSICPASEFHLNGSDMLGLRKTNFTSGQQEMVPKRVFMHVPPCDQNAFRFRHHQLIQTSARTSKVMIDDPYISRLTGSESRLPRPSVRRKTSSMILDRIQSDGLAIKYDKNRSADPHSASYPHPLHTTNIYRFI